MTDKSVMMMNLEKMVAATSEWEIRDSRFVKVRQNYLYKGIPNKDISEGYQRVLKAKRTFENRLNKMRLEWEVIGKEFKELVAEYDRRINDYEFEEEQKKQQEEKEIDVRQFISPVVDEENKNQEKPSTTRRIIKKKVVVKSPDTTPSSTQ